MKFSMSGLVKYVKKNIEVQDKLIAHINLVNKKKETDINIGNVVNSKNIINFAKHSELFNKDGSKKMKFSIQILFYTASRIAESNRKMMSKKNSPSASSQSIWTVKNK